MWCHMSICPKPSTPWARMFGRKTARERPKATGFGSARPEQESMSETQNTPRLAQNAPFAHLGAPRACQSVVLSVHMPKTRHYGPMFEQNNGPKTARTTTEFGLATGLREDSIQDFPSLRISFDLGFLLYKLFEENLN